MTETDNFKKVRLFKVSREMNIAVDSLVEHLVATGHGDALTGKGINASITNEDAYLELLEEFADDKALAARIREKRAAKIALDQSIDGEDTDTDDSSTEEEEIDVPAELESDPDPVADVPAESAEITEPQAEFVEIDDVPDAKEDHDDIPVDLPATEEAVTASEPTEDAPSVETPEAGIEPSTDEPTTDEPTDEAPAVDSTAETVVAEPSDSVESETTTEPSTSSPKDPGTATGVSPEESTDVKPPDGAEEKIIGADRYKLQGTKILGKIDLGTVEEAEPGTKRRRKRKRKPVDASAKKTATKSSAKEPAPRKKKGKRGPSVNQADVEQSLQETLRELEMGASRSRQKRRRAKRDERAEAREKEAAQRLEEDSVLSVTEFVSTGELANLMDVGVNELIGTLFAAGMMVSINQRLDADTITFVADEYGYEVEFITDFTTTDIVLEEDDPADLENRAPVVTVMGHVDHGKTSLLDHIRSENVVAGEAGGITQHIGAYQVQLSSGKIITFLDTPGHEAFTAMRARGAQVTDIVILVVAADDAVMPQTIEAINHAKAAEVPLVVAINKIDKPNANDQRVMQQLADHNVLVEPYGGKIQAELVSAKTGQGIQSLLDKVLLEAEMLDLKANPSRGAVCTVVESRLEKGRGNVATVLVQNGTLRVGDPFVAGIYYGRVRAMFDERDKRTTEVGPAMPAQVIGIEGAPEVGDTFIVVPDEKEAKEISHKRQQIHREQALRQHKHITLDEIGRRLALGEFRELHLIVKGDVGGSVEALSDALLKLSTEEVVVNIIHKGVGVDQRERRDAGLGLERHHHRIPGPSGPWSPPVGRARGN